MEKRSVQDHGNTLSPSFRRSNSVQLEPHAGVLLDSIDLLRSLSRFPSPVLNDSTGASTQPRTAAEVRGAVELAGHAVGGAGKVTHRGMAVEAQRPGAHPAVGNRRPRPGAGTDRAAHRERECERGNSQD